MKIVRFEFAFFGINSYVLIDTPTGECAIVDPGMSNQKEKEALVNFIGKHDLKVTHIINTHMHIDHVIGDRLAKELFDVPLYAHKDDEMLGNHVDQQAYLFGVEEEVKSVTADHELRDGDRIQIGVSTLEVLHVPGHSPGSIALYDREGHFVVVGDALFKNSIGRTDLPGGNYGQLIDAIKDKLLALPDDTMVFPGHGPATTIGEEKKNNPFLK